MSARMTNLHCTVSVLLCVCFLSTVLPQGTAGGTIFEKEVVDKLLENYSTDARPGKPPLDITTIYIDVVLAQIQQLDAVEQVLTSNLWVRQSWNDDHLTWNPEENGNVTAVYVNSENIWRPDTILYNRIHDEGFSSTPDTNAIIKYNGDVFWPYPVTARTSCLLDISLFPYDVQRCPLEFGSWTYNAEQLALVNVSPEGDTEEFIENGEWILRSFEADRHLDRNVSGKPFQTIEYTIEISRRTLYYSYYVVGPSVLLALLAIMGFCLPSSTNEKLSLSITILLALVVFFQYLTEQLPPKSTSIPLIGRFFGGMILLITLSSVMTIFILGLHFRGPKLYPVPMWLRPVFFMGPPKVWKIEVVRKEDAQTTKKNGVPGDTALSDSEFSRTIARIEQSISDFVQEEELKLYYTALRKEWELLAKRIDFCLLMIFLVSFFITTVAMLASSLSSDVDVKVGSH